MDIEGSEVEVLPDLIHEKSLQNIDGIMVEFHLHTAKNPKRKEATEAVKTLTHNYIQFNNLVNQHQLEIIDLDDESYYLSKKALPRCQIAI